MPSITTDGTAAVYKYTIPLGCVAAETSTNKPPLPDIRSNTLVRVINKGTSLQLVKGPVCKILAQQVGSHPLSPLQSQARLQARDKELINSSAEMARGQPGFLRRCQGRQSAVHAESASGQAHTSRSTRDML